jgi:hypothetical protein
MYFNFLLASSLQYLAEYGFGPVYFSPPFSLMHPTYYWCFSMRHTANLPSEALEQLPSSFESGIYLGWATVDGSGPYKMVASVGCECPAYSLS